MKLRSVYRHDHEYPRQGERAEITSTVMDGVTIVVHPMCIEPGVFQFSELRLIKHEVLP